ncbi:four helix bundle protein [Paenibacillus sp. JTLBN-2024]
MKDPRDLDISERIRKLSKNIHQLSLTFPKYEIYEIGSQLRRATDSIYLNLFEGNSTIYPKTYIKHLDSAIGSANEVRGILDLILDREYITKEKYEELEKEFKEIQFILKAIMNKEKYKLKGVA